jgi:hypothetical protein
MLSVLFAIALMLGAVTAIRRSPAYSAQSLWRSVPIVLLAIAAVIALVIAAVRFAGNRSPAIIVTTMVAVILFSCFFLVYVIYTVATPKAAKLVSTLPPGAKLVHVHRRKVYRWFRIVALLLLIFCTAGLLLPGDWRIVPLSLAAFLLFISAVLLPILYFSMRLLDVSLTALQADPWVHWTYSPEQWLQWSQVQVERLQATPPSFQFKRDWRKLAFALVFIAAGVYFFVPGPLLWKTAYIAFISAILIVIPILSARSARAAPEKLRARLRTAAPEVFFGRDGVFTNGALTTWLTSDVFLTAASVDERAPRSLFFRFEKDVPNPYGPLQIIPIEQAVLIPADKEHDLSLLQEKLTTRCPTARITLA